MFAAMFIVIEEQVIGETLATSPRVSQGRCLVDAGECHGSFQMNFLPSLRSGVNERIFSHDLAGRNHRRFRSAACKRTSEGSGFCASDARGDGFDREAAFNASFGCMTAAEADVFDRVIEEDCEQIKP